MADALTGQVSELQANCYDLRTKFEQKEARAVRAESEATYCSGDLQRRGTELDTLNRQVVGLCSQCD